MNKALQVLFESNTSPSMQSIENFQFPSNIVIGDANFNLGDFMIVMFNEKRDGQ